MILKDDHRLLGILKVLTHYTMTHKCTRQPKFEPRAKPAHHMLSHLTTTCISANYFIHSALRAEQLNDLSHLLCLSQDCNAEVFVIQKLSFVPEDFRDLSICQPLTGFTSLNNSLIFFCLPGKNANDQHLCVNLYYSGI